MIEIYKDGYVEKVDGFKYLHNGDIFRVIDSEGTGSLMMAKGEPFEKIRNGRKVISIKADFISMFD